MWKLGEEKMKSQMPKQKGAGVEAFFLKLSCLWRGGELRDRLEGLEEREWVKLLQEDSARDSSEHNLICSGTPCGCCSGREKRVDFEVGGESFGGCRIAANGGAR